MYRHLSASICLILAACAQDFAIAPDVKEPEVPEDTDLALPALNPDIEITPVALDFGELPPTCPAADQDVTITNVGEADLEIDDIALRGASKDPYKLRASPTTLAPGDSMIVTVGFQADAIEDYSQARVEVTSNDPDEAVATVALTAAGSIAAFKKELFIQEQGSGVDVLFTIDYSGSMSEELDALQNAFGVFITNFVNLGLDYHIAVIAEDPGCPEFLGPVIDSSNPDPVAEFVRQTGLGGCGGEEPFAGSKAALTEPALSGANAGFLRPNATLAVVAITDEPGDDTMTTGAYVTWLKSLKPSPTDVSFSGLTAQNSGFGCLAAPAPAPRYHTVINQTGGVWGDICNVNLRPFLSYLSYVAAGLEYRFALGDTPTSTNPSAITVTVNGASVPFSSIDGWTYDAATNSVELHGDAIPDPGDSIEVRYPYDPGC